MPLSTSGLTSTLCAAALLATSHVSADDLRLYMIGNSLTDGASPGRIAGMAESRGHEMLWGRDTASGYPLEYHWKTPGTPGVAQNMQAPVGQQNMHWDRSLTDFAWDAVSLQPYSRLIETRTTNGGDYEYAVRFINVLATQPGNLDADGKVDTQVYLYSHWPDRDAIRDANNNVIGYQPVNFKSQWDRDYAAGDTGTDWNDIRTRDYFESLMHTLNNPAARWSSLTHPTEVSFDGGTLPLRDPAELLNKPVRIVPVGDVLYALQTELEANPTASLALYGIDDVDDLYADGVHLTEAGNLVASLTFFATVYAEDPAGISAARGYTFIDPDLAALMERVTWDVVNGHPYSGVSVAVPEPGAWALLLASLLPGRRRRGDACLTQD